MSESSSPNTLSPSPQIGHSAIARDALSSLPTELLLNILGNLQVLELKRVRSLDKRINSLAEGLLFRGVFLERNVESFLKLRAIASRPKLSQHVRKLIYSGLVVRCNPEDFDAYISRPRGGHNHWPVFFDQFNYSQLGRVFRQACERSLGESLVPRYITETEDLANAFRNLPGLEELVLDARDEPKDLWKAQDCSGLTTNEYSYQFTFHETQLAALVTAACTTGKRIKSFKILGFPGSSMRELTNAVDMMGPVLQYCRTFILHVAHDYYSGSNFKRFASLATHTPELETLELLSTSSKHNIMEKMRLSLSVDEFLHQDAHWSRLNRLQLGGIQGTQTALQDFLKAHAGTLRVLKLGDIFLRPNEASPSNRNSPDSIITLISSLQATMKLRSVSLSGTLSAHDADSWAVDKNGDHGTFSPSAISESLCLKQRIEQYVIKGGECPLRFEDGRYLTDLGLDGDESWRPLS